MSHFPMRTCLPKSAAPSEQVSTDANARTITGLRVEITLTLYSNTGLGWPITAYPEVSPIWGRGRLDDKPTGAKRMR